MPGTGDMHENMVLPTPVGLQPTASLYSTSTLYIYIPIGYLYVVQNYPELESERLGLPTRVC